MTKVFKTHEEYLEYHQRYRDKNREKIRAYKKQYMRKWRKKGKVALKKKIESNRQQVSKAIREGTLEKKPCEMCGKEPSQAHHDDYKKPLSVRWLCGTHHKQAHKKIYNTEGLLINNNYQ